MAAIQKLLTSGNLEENSLVLDILQNVAFSGSEKEKEIVHAMTPELVKLAELKNPVDLARKALGILQYTRNENGMKSLVSWIQNADDAQYAALGPTNLMINAGYFGLKRRARREMYELLKANPDQRTQKRVLEMLDTLRKSGG